MNDVVNVGGKLATVPTGDIFTRNYVLNARDLNALRIIRTLAKRLALEFWPCCDTSCLPCFSYPCR